MKTRSPKSTCPTCRHPIRRVYMKELGVVRWLHYGKGVAEWCQLKKAELASRQGRLYEEAVMDWAEQREQQNCYMCIRPARYHFRTNKGDWADGCETHYIEQRMYTALGKEKAQALYTPQKDTPIGSSIVIRLEGTEKGSPVTSVFVLGQTDLEWEGLVLEADGDPQSSNVIRFSRVFWKQEAA
jgi:hypothetical protein